MTVDGAASLYAVYVTVGRLVAVATEQVERSRPFLLRNILNRWTRAALGARTVSRVGCGAPAGARPKVGPILPTVARRVEQEALEMRTRQTAPQQLDHVGRHGVGRIERPTVTPAALQVGPQSGQEGP